MYADSSLRSDLHPSRKTCESGASRADSSPRSGRSTVWLALALTIVLAGCSSPTNPSTGDDVGFAPDADEEPACDPDENPCRPLVRAPVARCAVTGTAPGGLPQLDRAATAHAQTIVAAARDDEGRLLFAHDDGRIADADGATIISAVGDLQSFAPHPNAQGRVVYSSVRDDDLVVVDADASQQAELLRVPYSSDAVGGAVAFDSAGRLLVALGDDDQVLARTAQDPLSLHGSVLRIELGAIGTPYSIPADNPYGDGARGAPEVFAYGVHDPQSIDATGTRIWLTDRGTSRDEVHVVEADRNLGWPLMDGRQCAPEVVCSPARFNAPVVDYVRTESSCGVAGGAYYPADGAIEELRDAFVYADRCDGVIRALRIGGDGRIHSDILAFDDSEAIVAVPSATLLVGAQSMIELSVGEDASMLAFPTKLSETGCFDLAADGLQPADGVIPFYVRSPLWTDGAWKRRFFVIPEGESATVDEWGHLVFPPGSLMFKLFGFTFEDGARPVEMRVMRRNPQTWSYYSYRFDEDGDATVLPGKHEDQFQVVDGDETVAVDYLYPDAASCRTCHSGSREVLGPRIEQLAGAREYGPDDHRDQLAELIDLGMVDLGPVEPTSIAPLPVPADDAAPVAERARAYLDANCSHCHRPGGWVPPDLTLDLRYSTTLAETHTCDVRLQYDNPFVPGEYRIVPGSPDDSVLYQRMMTRGFGQMPLFATSRVDALADELMRAWISELDCDEQP